MIYVDASAIVALILDEPEASEIATVLDQGDAAFTSPLAVYEATMAVARLRSIPVVAGNAEIKLLLGRASIAIEPLSEEHGDIALAAFDRFGKGRHPAKLNVGDCFGYACAAARGARILFKGNDFNQTDLPSARLSQ